jgi:hypothetical protein
MKDWLVNDVSELMVGDLDYSFVYSDDHKTVVF